MAVTVLPVLLVAVDNPLGPVLVDGESGGEDGPEEHEGTFEALFGAAGVVGIGV